MLIQHMKEQKVGLILHGPYYDMKHAKFAAQNRGAAVVTLANQSGTLPVTEEYLALVDADVKAVAAALGGKR